MDRMIGEKQAEEEQARIARNFENTPALSSLASAEQQALTPRAGPWLERSARPIRCGCG
jgi:hypothetical protein